MRFITLAVICILSVGCTHYTKVQNTSISTIQSDQGYRPPSKRTDVGADSFGDVLVFVSFSGGGTRAATLSYGVLEELRDTKITIDGKSKSLLDEVDTISSVSGGSFTAAYYGLHGDKIFDDFEIDFLKKNIQEQLLDSLFSFHFWWRALTSGFDRTEMAIQNYEENIFRNATFADLKLDGPYIQINATDIGSGERFQFTQDYFDLICSDLNKFHIARAVAASSAVPVAFSPIVLENNAAKCTLPSQHNFNGIKKNKSQLKNALISYRDIKQRPYIHLVDGGIIDNLGVRALPELVGVYGGAEYAAQKLLHHIPKHMVVIVVNAETSPVRSFERSAMEPNIGMVVGAVTDIQITRYNQDSIALIKRSLSQWTQEIKEKTGESITPHYIEVSFTQEKNKQRKLRLNKISTSLQLPKGEIDTLKIAGRELLRESTAFKNLLHQLQ